MILELIGFSGLSIKMEFENQVVIVTGATKGIGKAIALAFAESGAGIFATGRSSTDLNAVCKDIKCLGSKAVPFVSDLRDDESPFEIVREALSEFGHVDILINNAGITHDSSTMVDFDMQLWKEVLQVNLVAPAFLIKGVLPSMIERNYGKIINISSIGGRRGGKCRSAYRASKAGLINLTESVAAEVREYGIDVNCICPGATDTEGFRSAFPNATLDNTAPPSDIAKLALFLASKNSIAVTGTSIDAFGSSNPIFHSDSEKGRI